MPRVNRSHVAPGWGARLTLARVEAGLSQREVARRTEGALTAAYISRLEADQRVPTVDAIWTLADAIGTSREWLRTGRTDTHAPALDAFLLVNVLRVLVDDLQGRLTTVREAVSIDHSVRV